MCTISSLSEPQRRCLFELCSGSSLQQSFALYEWTTTENWRPTAVVLMWCYLQLIGLIWTGSCVAILPSQHARQVCGSECRDTCIVTVLMGGTGFLIKGFQKSIYCTKPTAKVKKKKDLYTFLDISCCPVPWRRPWRFFPLPLSGKVHQVSQRNCPQHHCAINRNKREAMRHIVHEKRREKVGTQSKEMVGWLFGGNKATKKETEGGMECKWRKRRKKWGDLGERNWKRNSKKQS